jgi:hypothetical protein
MTRKDYQMIAGAFAESLDRVDGGHQMSEWLAVSGAALAVSDVLAADNPRFDRVKFLEACGL